MQIEYFADEDFFGGAYFSIVIQPYQAPVDSTVTVAALTNGAIPTEFEETYTSGDNVAFSIVPNDGYVLASIVDENNDELYIDVSVDDESAANYTYSASFTMPNEDVVLKAVFGHRVLKGSHENGRILDNNKQSGFGYAEGEEVTLVLKGDSGYVPTSASIEGHPEINVDVIEVKGLFGSSYQAKFTMPDFEVTVNAVFTAAEA